MATISIYPKVWQLYQQARLRLTDQHGILLLNDQYTYNESHRNFANIPTEAIVAEISLGDITYEGANDRFIVADASVTEVTDGQTIQSIVLFEQGEYQSNSHLIYYSDDATGLPLLTTGADISISFPNGVLVLAPDGYTTPAISIVEV